MLVCRCGWALCASYICVWAVCTGVRLRFSMGELWKSAPAEHFQHPAAGCREQGCTQRAPSLPRRANESVRQKQRYSRWGCCLVSPVYTENPGCLWLQLHSTLTWGCLTGVGGSLPLIQHVLQGIDVLVHLQAGENGRISKSMLEGRDMRSNVWAPICLCAWIDVCVCACVRRHQSTA